MMTRILTFEPRLTTQNEFKLQHNICKQPDVRHFRIALYGQVIHGRRYRWLISYMTPQSDGTPMNIRMYFIFLENRSIGLHFAADNISLSSFNFFWWAPEFLFSLFRWAGASAVQGHPRSLILVPIESAYVTSY